MNIQSCTICVPGNKCPNNCKFCVSKMNKTDAYPVPQGNVYSQLDIVERLQYVRDCGCQDLIFSGSGEPLEYLEHIKYMLTVCNSNLSTPFKKIELQTSGVDLTDEKLTTLRDLRVKTISLSLSSFDNKINAEVNQTAKGKEIDIAFNCAMIKSAGFNLRLSLNLSTEFYRGLGPTDWHFNEHPRFHWFTENAERLGADEMTFRRLYSSGKDLPQDKWIKEHTDQGLNELFEYVNEEIFKKGTKIRELSFGATQYNVNGINMVVDGDCMSQVPKDTIKYAILRPNLKLYSRWDVPALIF